MNRRNRSPPQIDANADDRLLAPIGQFGDFEALLLDEGLHPPVARLLKQHRNRFVVPEMSMKNFGTK